MLYVFSYLYEIVDTNREQDAVEVSMYILKNVNVLAVMQKDCDVLLSGLFY